MLDYINVDIPQLPFWESTNYSTVTKRFKDVLNQHFLSDYLRQKFTDYSVRHNTLNEQLRDIYLTHAHLAKSRINEETYSLNSRHYQQLFLTDQVCKSLSLMVAELFYCIYFMKQLQVKSQIPGKIEISAAIGFVMTDQAFTNHFATFLTFVRQTEEIRHCYQLNSIRSGYDFLLTEEQPVYFVTDKNGSITIHSLSKFINDYTSFFLTCKQVLRQHAPEVIAVGLEMWKE